MDDVKKTLIGKYAYNEEYNVEDIPSGLFKFFIYEARSFKDGTSNWNIGVNSHRNHSSKFITLETIRGTREDARNRLDEIIREEREFDKEREAER